MKINKNNKDEIINRYLDLLLFQSSKSIMYGAAQSFLLEEKTSLNNEDLEEEISQTHPFLLVNPNNSKIKINDSNRMLIISDYVLRIVSDLTEERPRYALYNYAKQFLVSQKKSLNNEELEAEIVSIFPELLMENSNE